MLRNWEGGPLVLICGDGLSTLDVTVLSVGSRFSNKLGLGAVQITQHTIHNVIIFLYPCPPGTFKVVSNILRRLYFFFYSRRFFNLVDHFCVCVM